MQTQKLEPPSAPVEILNLLYLKGPIFSNFKFLVVGEGVFLNGYDMIVHNEYSPERSPVIVISTK